MIQIVQCSECALCARVLECGFTGGDVYLCTDRGMREVNPSDGCTLGEAGEPQRLKDQAEVTLSGHEAVYGGE